jgi:hypothetical protein
MKHLRQPINTGVRTTISALKAAKGSLVKSRANILDQRKMLSPFPMNQPSMCYDCCCEIKIYHHLHHVPPYLVIRSLALKITKYDA